MLWRVLTPGLECSSATLPRTMTTITPSTSFIFVLFFSKNTPEREKKLKLSKSFFFTELLIKEYTVS